MSLMDSLCFVLADPGTAVAKKGTAEYAEAHGSVQRLAGRLWLMPEMEQATSLVPDGT